jgi:protein gp37
MTGIQWTGVTWNPTTGCDKISPGCGLPRFDGDDTGGCYAMAMAKRLKGMGQAKYQNDGDPRTSGPGFALTVHPDALTVPLRWRKPRRVFVNSMSDLGHARVPADFLAQVWAVMAVTPQHTYQILSKRPHRLSRVILDNRFEADVRALAMQLDGGLAWRRIHWPLPNVWMGTSIELDRYHPRADSLRETPATVRFLSLEPLLGPLPSLDLTGIDWAIIGGESGPGAREMDLGWARDLIGRCREAGTAVFVKQLGSVLGAGPKGGDMGYWPEDLRIREFPRVPEVVSP